MNEEIKRETEESGTAAKKLSGKKIGVIGAAAVFLLALIIGFCIYNAPANRLSRQLDLGQKYLVEQNYEQAIVEFDKAIAIDPMNEGAYLGKAEAYIGLNDNEKAIETYKMALENIPESVESYLGLAKIYQEAGELEVALETLKRGYEVTRNERIQAAIQAIEEKLAEEEVRRREDEEARLKAEEKAKIDTVLKPLYDHFEEDDFEAVKEYMRSSAYLDLEDKVKENRRVFYSPDYDGEYFEGKGIAVYLVEDGVVQKKYLACYYGDFKNDIREGRGIWLIVNPIDSISLDWYRCQGDWKRDMPNGNFEAEWIWKEDMLEGGIYDLFESDKGTVVDGVYEGEIESRHKLNDGSRELLFHYMAKQGVYQVIDYRDNKAIVAYNENPREYESWVLEHDHVYKIAGF